MRLSTVGPGQVVKNVNNGSFYLTEQMERGRMKIRPLELFPNGMLISKPAPTLVDADIEVMLVGPWADGMVVEGKPSRSRADYEQELLCARRDLGVLEQEYDELPRDGRGKLSRGSHANKLRAKRLRIDALHQGLGLAGRSPAPTQAQSAVTWPHVQTAVQLPSGLPAVVVGLRPVGDTMYARCRTRVRGALMEVEAPSQVLRPFAMASICDR